MSRQQLIAELASIGADYRPRPLSPYIVERWINQFPSQWRDRILAEMAHVLRRTYFSRAYIEAFLRSVATNKGLSDPKAFWKGMNFLKLQTVGNSQNDLLAVFDRIITDLYGVSISECGQSDNRFLYLDDALFSGNRIKKDIAAWVRTVAPKNAQVDVVALARHTQGSFFADSYIASAAKEAGKNIAVRFPARFIIEDRKSRTDVSDVLRPTSLGSYPTVQEYAETLGTDLKLRNPPSVGGQGFFSSEDARSVLEQQLLVAGVEVRQMCPLLPKHMRPLGCTVQYMLGFGSTIVTYRNCPNNAPLAFWAGDPWFPLFPRETN